MLDSHYLNNGYQAINLPDWFIRKRDYEEGEHYIWLVWKTRIVEKRPDNIYLGSVYTSRVVVSVYQGFSNNHEPQSVTH